MPGSALRQPGAVRVYAPASVSNVGPGFDVFGFAVEGPGDVVTAEAVGGRGVELAAVLGDDGRLPRDPLRNTAAVAAAAALAAAGQADRGVRLTVEKRMPLASGLGSSAASAVAGAVAVDALLGLRLSQSELLAAALAGERVGCGAAHADNVAPSLYGGFVLVRGAGAAAGEGIPAVDVVGLPVPSGLCCALVRPHLEVETGAARALLGDTVALADATAQWGNAAGLVVALFRRDFDLLARCLVDRVAEPRRSALVPGFDVAVTAARAAGAIGAGLSGSGPSIFALCAERTTAERVATAMVDALAAAGVAADRYVSAVGADGARLLAAGEEPAGALPRPPTDAGATAPGTS